MGHKTQSNLFNNDIYTKDVLHRNNYKINLYVAKNVSRFVFVYIFLFCFVLFWEGGSNSIQKEHF